MNVKLLKRNRKEILLYQFTQLHIVIKYLFNIKSTIMANSAWKVTNGTTKKNIVVINASVDSDSPKAFYYDQKITLLSFASAKVLAPGNSDTITLPDVNKDNSGYNLPFTFIIADAETLVPLKSVTCKADLSDLKDLIVDDSAVSDIAQSFDFHKNIAAVPGSELAINFAALDLADEKAVSNFFNSTDDYKKVTLDALHLVQSYYNALPYGWANGKDTVIYLYSKKDDDGSEEGTLRSIGTVKITNDWLQPVPVTPADPFKLELKLDGEDAKPLYFNKGIFRDTQDASKAKICLAGSFFIPSLLLDEEGNEQMSTYLVGSKNGISVFGFESVEPDGINDDGSFWKLLDVNNFRDGFTLAMYGVGIIAAIALLVKLGQFLKWCKERGNPAIDAKQRAAQAEKLEGELITEIRNEVQQVNDDIIVPQHDNIQPAQADYNVEQLRTKTNQGFRNIQRMSAAQEKILLAIGSKCSSAVLEDITDCIELVRKKCFAFDTANPQSVTEFRSQMPDIVKMLRENASRIVLAKTMAIKRLTTTELNGYERAMETFDNIFTAQQRLDKEIKDVEEGRDEREIIEDPVIEN
ncbi:hypothetical protein DC498_11055 [Terrimonas sp.]|nr:hypothetical protein DC498_11055 [Terrimonas sp.]